MCHWTEEGDLARSGKATQTQCARAERRRANRRNGHDSLRRPGDVHASMSFCAKAGAELPNIAPTRALRKKTDATHCPIFHRETPLRKGNALRVCVAPLHVDICFRRASMPMSVMLLPRLGHAPKGLGYPARTDSHRGVPQARICEAPTVRNECIGVYRGANFVPDDVVTSTPPSDADAARFSHSVAHETTQVIA
jgi:hypothetical protein